MGVVLVDPLTAGIIGGALGYDPVKRVLGPSADYLGTQLKDWVEKRHRNFNIIIRNAEKRIPDLEDGKGVSPRILKDVIFEGSYVEDLVAAEYWGGVLASSRNISTIDDRGIRFTKKLQLMTSVDIRFHYALHRTARALLTAQDLEEWYVDAPHIWIFVPASNLFELLDIENQSYSDLEIQVMAILNNLSYLGFLFEGISCFKVIDLDLYKMELPVCPAFVGAFPDGRHYFQMPSPGVVCGLSRGGIQLFMWAFGQADREMQGIIADDLDVLIPGFDGYFKDAIQLPYAPPKNAKA